MHIFFHSFINGTKLAETVDTATVRVVSFNALKQPPQNAVKIDSVKLQKQHSHTESKQSQTKNKISLFNTINPKKKLCHKKSIK